MNRMTFETNKNGNIIQNEVIATYYDEGIDKHFIVYTDSTYTNNKLNIYCDIYTESNGGIALTRPYDNITKKISLELVKEIVNEAK